MREYTTLVPAVLCWKTGFFLLLQVDSIYLHRRSLAVVITVSWNDYPQVMIIWRKDVRKHSTLVENDVSGCLDLQRQDFTVIIIWLLFSNLICLISFKYLSLVQFKQSKEIIWLDLGLTEGVKSYFTSFSFLCQIFQFTWIFHTDIILFLQ